MKKLTAAIVSSVLGFATAASFAAPVSSADHAANTKPALQEDQATKTVKPQAKKATKAHKTHATKTVKKTDIKPVEKTAE